MNILVNTKNVKLTRGFKFDIERRVNRMYQKASDSIKGIKVTFVDVNGPKGGDDKQCKLQLALEGSPSVLIVTQKNTMEKAFVEALKRANRVLFKRLKKSKRFSHEPLYMAALQGTESPA